MMKRLGPRYGRNSKTAHTNLRLCLRVVSSLCSALGSMRDQYLIRLEVRSSFCAYNINPVTALHELVSAVHELIAPRSASFNGIFNSVMRLLDASFVALVRQRKYIDWSFMISFSVVPPLLKSSKPNGEISSEGPKRISVPSESSSRWNCIRLRLRFSTDPLVTFLQRDQGN